METSAVASMPNSRSCPSADQLIGGGPLVEKSISFSALPGYSVSIPSMSFARTGSSVRRFWRAQGAASKGILHPTCPEPDQNSGHGTRQCWRSCRRVCKSVLRRRCRSWSLRSVRERGGRKQRNVAATL